MAKGGEFGSIPKDIFDLLVGVYTPPKVPPAVIEITDANRIKGLLQLAKAEHAAATATMEPHMVTLTMVCIGLSERVAEFKAAKTQLERDAAVNALLLLTTKLEGLWV